jgi:hypothetical protein
MGAVEAILAVVGLVALVLLAIAVWPSQDAQVAPAPIEDRAAPYREALHAAVRLHRSAQDLEQQIWAEAARHQEPQPDDLDKEGWRAGS